MITDNIMLGGRDDAENAAQLMEYGVTHVLNTAQQLPNYFPNHFVYLKVGLIGENATGSCDRYSTLSLQRNCYTPSLQMLRMRTY
jgi:hypothetical protein